MVGAPSGYSADADRITVVDVERAPSSIPIERQGGRRSGPMKVRVRSCGSVRTETRRAEAEASKIPAERYAFVDRVELKSLRDRSLDGAHAVGADTRRRVLLPATHP